MRSPHPGERDVKAVLTAGARAGMPSCTSREGRGRRPRAGLARGPEVAPCPCRGDQRLCCPLTCLGRFQTGRQLNSRQLNTRVLRKEDVKKQNSFVVRCKETADCQGTTLTTRVAASQRRGPRSRSITRPLSNCYCRGRRQDPNPRDLGSALQSCDCTSKQV